VGVRYCAGCFREHPIFAKIVTLTPLNPDAINRVSTRAGEGGKQRILPSPLAGEGLGVRGVQNWILPVRYAIANAPYGYGRCVTLSLRHPTYLVEYETIHF
jgi:hypothetical protein